MCGYLKAVKTENIEGIAKALKQIEDKKYETELLEKGIKDIVFHKLN